MVLHSFKKLSERDTTFGPYEILRHLLKTLKGLINSHFGPKDLSYGWIGSYLGISIHIFYI